jgi:hypothetical protein
VCIILVEKKETSIRTARKRGEDNVMIRFKEVDCEAGS